MSRGSRHWKQAGKAAEREPQRAGAGLEMGAKTVASGLQGKIASPAVVLVLLALVGCAAFTPSGPGAFIGRYQRMGDAPLVSEPDFLMAEYLEFRVGGQAVALIRDEARDRFLRTSMWRYRILDNGRIEASGRCWRGKTAFDCTHSYDARLSEGTLTISDRNDPAKFNTYRRLGDVPADLPLQAPSPTPTPKSQ